MINRPYLSNDVKKNSMQEFLLVVWWIEYDLW